jgi:hypothetical protein
MAISGIRLVHVNTQRVNIPFTVRGEFLLDDQISTTMIEYSDDVNTARPAASMITAGDARFEFVHPGYDAVGTHTLTISLVTGLSVRSNPFDVVEA